MSKIDIHKKHGFKKFLILLSILFLYSGFVMVKFGVKDGLGATFLTWAFFVTCTPIADAGFLVDFPIRVLFGLKMVLSEIIVWAVAFLIVGLTLVFNNSIFSTLAILELFHEVLTNPWPFWIIILVSGIGTFLSIHIGDKIYTLVQTKKNHGRKKKLQMKRLIIEVVLLVFVIGLYTFLLDATGISIANI